MVTDGARQRRATTARAGEHSTSLRHPDLAAMLTQELPGLVRFAVGLTGQREDAEDLVATAVAGLMSGTAPIAAPGAYLRRSIVNSYLNEQRHQKVVQQHDARPETEPSFSGIVDRRIDLNTALADLSTIQRAVIIFRYFEDLTVHQTADVLGRPEGTIRRICHDALALLRRSPALNDTDPQDRERP